MSTDTSQEIEESDVLHPIVVVHQPHTHPQLHRFPLSSSLSRSLRSILPLLRFSPLLVLLLLVVEILGYIGKEQSQLTFDAGHILVERLLIQCVSLRTSSTRIANASGSSTDQHDGFVTGPCKVRQREEG